MPDKKHSAAKKTPYLLSALFVALIGIFLYLPQVSQTIGWYNSSEFVIAAMTLDVPHAPGYPLFTRLGNLANSFFPGGSPAFRLNLLTAIVGVSGAALLTILLLNYGLSPWSAMLAGILLLSCATYRDQSILAEVYTLEICLIIAGLFIGLQLEKERFTPWCGFFAGLIGTLGVGHRPTFGLYALTLLFFVFASSEQKKARPDLNFWFSMALGMVLGLLPSFDLFLRLQNPARILLDPLTGQGIGGFFRIFTGTIYSGGFGVFDAGEILERFVAFIKMAAIEGSVWIIIGPPALLMLKRLRTSALPRAFMAIFAVNLIFVLNYNAFEAHTMLLPAIMSLIGLSVIVFDRIGPERLKLFATIAIASTSIFGLSLHRPDTDSPEKFVKNAFADLPAGSMVLMSNDVEFRPYWFMRTNEGFRKDLAIQLVDKIETAELATLAPAVRAGKLYGSLVYPADGRHALTASYSIVADGYLHRVLSPPLWNEIQPHNGSDSRFLITPDFADFKWVGGATDSANLPRAGSALNYAYTFTGSSADFKNLAVVTVLVDSGGMPTGSHGLLTGHDLHFPAEFFCRTGRPDYAAFKVFRSLVLPADLSPGHYRIMMLPFKASDKWPVKWFKQRPDNVSIFNSEGFLEVFALKYGLSCRPLIKIMPLQHFLNTDELQPVAAGWQQLASFTLQP